MPIYEVIRTRVLTIREEIVLVADNEDSARKAANACLLDDSFQVKETADRQVVFEITELAREEPTNG